jgi:hypothetical protein
MADTMAAKTPGQQIDKRPNILCLCPIDSERIALLQSSLGDYRPIGGMKQDWLGRSRPK